MKCVYVLKTGHLGVFQKSLLVTRHGSINMNRKIKGNHHFSRSGHLSTSMLDNCRSVNSEWYTTVALPKAFQAVWEEYQRPGFRESCCITTMPLNIPPLEQKHLLRNLVLKPWLPTKKRFPPWQIKTYKSVFRVDLREWNFV
ncbi:unnamed protein product [Parnassius mnemosyne]|uniref:Uncharacterized protein n=1 Tax=Parnassius mnemosyne TaxID=213953 RepID=A0AAV1LVZ9_9NEOP